MSTQHLCSSLRQAESSLACLYITPKGFALHAALLSFSIDALHWCPGPCMSPQHLCSSLRQAESSLACLYITPKGFALLAALLSFSIDAQH